MSKTLRERLLDSRDALDQVNAAILRHPSALPVEAEGSFRKLVEFGSDIEHWVGMIEARAAALQLLDGLEMKADHDDWVPFGSTRVKYQHVRFLGVAGYLTTTWALADRIANFAARVLCTPDAGRNEVEPAQLVSHFIQRDQTKKRTAAAVFESVRQTFGWPVGLCYAARNLFVHDGALVTGTDFFAGPSNASAFRVSADGWKWLEARVQTKYCVDSSHRRASAAWPPTPTDDFRKVLIVCEREMDDALGVLVGSACNSLRSHVGFMLGED